MDKLIRQTLATATAAYQRFEERFGDGDRNQQTRLGGWTVGDLVDHVSWGAAMEADAVRQAVGLAPRGLVQPTLTDSVAAFEDISTLSVAPETLVTLAAGTVPMAFAAPLFAFEAALHASDLDVALGGPGELSAQELESCEVLVGPMLDLMAAAVSADPVTIDLLGLGDGVRLVAAGGTWTRTTIDTQPATTTVRADPAALVLFVCGRIGADDPRLTVAGRSEHAARFKDEYFPGP